MLLGEPGSETEPPSERAPSHLPPRPSPPQAVPPPRPSPPQAVSTSQGSAERQGAAAGCGRTAWLGSLFKTFTPAQLVWLSVEHRPLGQVPVRCPVRAPEDQGCRALRACAHSARRQAMCVSRKPVCGETGLRAAGSLGAEGVLAAGTPGLARGANANEPKVREIGSPRQGHSLALVHMPLGARQ
uniref:Uncharacterized protein n=1 Tax=Myotis myotis TaxID=51298 RepID=A0A7J7V3X0_MYOMY|nr:hypothetical protein mMyoMyo1_008415 [Myotis myotis]